MAIPINRLARLLDGDGDRRERASRRAMTAAVVVSLIAHLLAIWRLPSMRTPSDELAEKRSGPLSVQIVPPPMAAPSRPAPPPPQAQRPRQPAPPQRRAERPVPKSPPQRVERPAPKPPARAERPPPRPPVIARAEPTLPSPRPAPAPSTQPPQPGAGGDLASFIEARRRARGETAPVAPPVEPAPSPAPAEDPNARANRIAAANLGLAKPPTFGPDPRKTGGIFNVTHISSDYAEFLFYGWNRDIKRNTVQTIEVRRGTNPNIQIAIVRRMIQIIRDYEKGDFTWESIRLGRLVTLSAAPRDNSGLEEFLLREFFETPAAARR